MDVGIEGAPNLTDPSGRQSGEFARQVRALRLRAGLTQEDLAERAGVSVATIGAIEEGLRRRPYPHTLAALADALNLEPASRAALVEAASPASRAAVAAPLAPSERPPDGGVPSLEAHLPIPPTVLIGRDHEIASLSRLLTSASPSARLLTLVGPGGVGKTRLGLAVADAVTPTFTDGVVFVDLAPVHDHRLVPAAIARVLAVREAGGQTAWQLLLAYLRDRRALLVLDNFEQVLGAAALLAELLATCPRVALLVTSRTALRVRSEQRVAVLPLPTPPPGPASLPDILASPAVQLFVERARSVTADFWLDAANASAVAAVCQRLDGLPLAIELAAARVALLPPSSLLGRLERRLTLLTGGPEDLPQRQQTLRNTLAWSHDLLGPGAQALFRRLGAFLGGCTLEAAEAICSDAEVPADALIEHLGELVDSSLLKRADGNGEPRFAMLETVREYAVERLAAAADAADVRNRHAAYFLEQVQTAELHLHGPDQSTWADRLERDHDNLLAALEWCLRGGSAVCGLLLATSMRWFWYMHGHYAEGRDRLAAAIARSAGEAPPESLAHALNAIGFMEVIRGKYAEAAAHLAEALEMGTRLELPEVRAFARRYLGFIANAEADYVTARAHLEHSLTIYQALGAEDDAGVVMMYLGDAALSEGDAPRATRLFEASGAILRRLGNTTVLPYPLRRLGYLALLRGDARQAVGLCMESLNFNRAVGEQQGVAASLVGLAAVAIAEQQPARAARVLGYVDQLLASVGAELFPFDRQQFEHALAAARQNLEAVAFREAWSSGAGLSLDEAVAAAVGDRSPR